MNDNNSSGPEMMIGGLVLFAILVAALAKVIAGVFNELGKMFSSFGIMAQNFAGMLWGIAQVVFWLAVIVFAIAASVYFTYKYIKLVKRGTEIMAEFEHKSLLLKTSIDEANRQLATKLSLQVADLSRELESALAKPEAAPKVDPPSPQMAQESADVSAQSEVVQKNNQSDTTTPTVSNPY